MSRSAARTATRMLKRDNGMWNGYGRIYNLDNLTYNLGYVEVNQQATSIFSRTISHKAWFSGDADIEEGALIQDRYSGKNYLVMSAVPEMSGGVTAYVDATLYLANAVCSIERYIPGTVDAFGYQTDPTTDIVALNVFLMVNPINLDFTEQPDALIDSSKIKAVLQSKHNIKVNDRIVTSTGLAYTVQVVDEMSLSGLTTVSVRKDLR